MNLQPRTTLRFVASFVVVIVFLFAIPISLIFAQAQSAPTATLKVTKTVPNVSLDDVATFRLVIDNNGTVPVFDIEVYEYISSALTPASEIVITSPVGESSTPLTTGGVGTASQVIVDPPSPASLMPGQSLSLQYKMSAPHSGDFQVPASLAWFSYTRDRSTIRSNYYSNGFILHIPNGYEKAVIVVFPYVLSGLTFAATITILFWARNRLQKLEK